MPLMLCAAVCLSVSQSLIICRAVISAFVYIAQSTLLRGRQPLFNELIEIKQLHASQPFRICNKRTPALRRIKLKASKMQVASMGSTTFRALPSGLISVTV
jgi:hypothetical protein